jgi:hypothetical protein
LTTNGINPSTFNLKGVYAEIVEGLISVPFSMKGLALAKLPFIRQGRCTDFMSGRLILRCIKSVGFRFNNILDCTYQKMDWQA